MFARLKASLLGLAVVGLTGGSGVSEARAAPKASRQQTLGALMERLSDTQSAVVAAERVAAKELSPTEDALARQLVAAQLAITEGRYEPAAIQCLDLVENHGETAAGRQAAYYLGVALMELGMRRWAVEVFSGILGDRGADARRFHQRSVARLFDLAVPRRPAGFARRPGLSATPELRARLDTVGGKAPPELLSGVVSEADAEKLIRWAESFPPEERSADLRYAYGRYLYLAGRPEAAQAEMDALNPLDIPMSRGGTNARWRVRAAYVAAAASARLGDIDDALARFQLITKARPPDERDRRIVDLAWMAQGRIHHDAGAMDEAMAAYRFVGRGSPFFPEALYESAWTLLEAGEDEQALAVLEQLLALRQGEPISLELKLLRGKVKIRAREYEAAEDEFLALRDEFKALVRRLAPQLERKADTARYFTAVIAEQMENFSLSTLLVPGALPVADSLPVSNAAIAVTRETGALQRELLEVRDLLARMEDALAAPEKARLFNDLGAQSAALDHVERELLEVRKLLVFQLAAESKTAFTVAEARRQALERRVDEPIPNGGMSRARIVAAIETTKDALAEVERALAAVRAELVGFEQLFARRSVTLSASQHQAFFEQAEVLRQEIGAWEREATVLRLKIERTQYRLRFDDPVRTAAREAKDRYRQHLTQMYDAAQRAAKNADVQTVWRRVEELQTRMETARLRLGEAAAARLLPAKAILEEERANLDEYHGTMQTLHGRVSETLGEVVQAVFRDVVSELAAWVVRSEVGLLDVAFAMKEAEAGEARRLEKVRSLELREIQRAVEMGAEASEQ